MTPPGLQQIMRRSLPDSIELGLAIKFGADGLRLLPEIRKIEESALQATMKSTLSASLSSLSCRAEGRRAF